MNKSIFQGYRELGVDNFYALNSHSYQNPHENDIKVCLSALFDFSRTSFVDLACGEGLVTKYLLSKNPSLDCYGVDKYLSKRYEEETGKPCFSFSFEQIADLKCNLEQKQTLVISYALDLIKPSYLNKFLYACAYTGFSDMLIIRPNGHIIESEHWIVSKTFRHGKAKACLYTNNLRI